MHDFARCDRQITVGGGVCVAVKKSLRSCTVPIDATDLEIVAVDIFGCNFKFRVVNVYRPPYYNEAARSSTLVLCDELSRLSSVK